MATIYRVRKSWNDPKSQKGAFSSLENAKKCADKYSYNVYGDSGKLVYPIKETQLYRVRKTWADEKSQIGAYKSLASAKALCNKYVGYHVYDNSGKVVWTSTKQAEVKQTVADIMKPLTDACKAQTSWAYKSTYKWQNKPTVAKSKTNGTCVTYVACVLQRINVLKSGQYIWHNGSGYGKGKVNGDINSYMTVTYMGNKTPTALKSKLKLGDIVMIDDNKSGKAGDGGHTEIFGGSFKNSKAKYFTGGTGTGHNTSNESYDNRKILAIVRLKTFKVTTSVKNGTITQTSEVLVKQNLTVKYSPLNGKKLKSVKVDGKAVDIKKYPSSYTFSGITANHKIVVEYA